MMASLSFSCITVSAILGLLLALSATHNVGNDPREEETLLMLVRTLLFPE